MFNFVHKFFHGDLPKNDSYFKILNENEYEHFKDCRLIRLWHSSTSNYYHFHNPTSSYYICEKVELRNGWLNIVDKKDNHYSLQVELISENEYGQLSEQYSKLKSERELNEKISGILAYKNIENRAEEAFDEFFNKTFDSVKHFLDSTVENDEEIFILTDSINYNVSQDFYIISKTATESFWEYQLKCYINNLHESIKSSSTVDYELIDKIRNLIKETVE